MRCPYCDKDLEIGFCPHLLLLVDVQFHELIGGAMMQVTQSRLSEIFDESVNLEGHQEAFWSLLDEVEQIAEFDMEEEYDFGPGSSGAYRYYFSARPKDSIDGYLGLIHAKKRG